MYTRFLWITLTLARCFLASAVAVVVVAAAAAAVAFGFTFWVLCFFSAFFSATVLSQVAAILTILSLS
uniref:Uncharacterized protein n=1 Tax=Arundo donax TaxID=35708 RepID=A0A0A8YD43_ARUDO